MDVDSVPGYIITLEEDNFKETKDRLEKAGFKNLEWFQGVNGKEMADQLRNDRAKLSYRALTEIDHSDFREAHSSMPSWGGVGCYLSHVGTWKAARESNNGILVFEQDAIAMSNDSYDSVKKVLEDLYTVENKLPDLVYIGGFNVPEMDPVKGLSSVGRVKSRVYGLEAYYISPEGATKLLQNAFPMEVQVDSYNGYVIAETYDTPNALKAYFMKEKFITQENNEGTSIQLKDVRDTAFDDGGHIWAYILISLLLLLLAYILYKNKREILHI